MSYNHLYPHIPANSGCYKCGQSPKPPLYPQNPLVPKPSYPCHPGGSYPYKPQYPAYPPKACAPCNGRPGCCYPPEYPPPPELNCCDDCGPDAPCCRNGSCAGCADFTKHLPYLMPRAIGCGKLEKCKEPYCLPIHPECLDNGSLPGRPPHTIVCVKNIGAAVVEECLDTDNENAMYDYFVRVKIPVDITIRDCAGFLHRIRSWFVEKVKIPLTFRVDCLPKNPLIYATAKVNLCYSEKTEAIVKDLTLPGNEAPYLDVCDEDIPGDTIHTFEHCPKLTVSVAACIIKLVPCGSPDDPYRQLNMKIPCSYPCDYKCR